MRREPACHQIETLLGKGQPCRFGVRRLDVGEPALCRELARFGQHLGGDVAGDDVLHVRGKRERRVARTGRHIEHAPMALRVDKRNEAREAFALRVHGRSGIVGGRRAEFLLDERACHE